jgi:hypothetical protein
MTFGESVAWQAKEVLKYNFKPSDNSPGDAYQIISETFNKRMSATYGAFRGIGGDDYGDPATDEQDTFVLMWDADKGKYGEPVPGKMRDLIEDEQAAHDTRSNVGKMLGEYRRQRKALIESRDKYGSELFLALDSAKQYFRRRISGVWSLYRQHVETAKRINLTGCDRYSCFSRRDVHSGATAEIFTRLFSNKIPHFITCQVNAWLIGSRRTYRHYPGVPFGHFARQRNRFRLQYYFLAIHN